MNHIPFLSVTAKDNFSFGFKIGQKLSSQIKKRISDNKKLYKKERMKNFSDLMETAQKFLPDISKDYPHLLAELRGMSEGAKVDFDELLVLMCEEELLDFRIPHCTNVAIQTKNGAVLGHNEDWSPAYKNNGLYVVKGKIKNRKFLALSYIGSLAGTSSGMNESFCYTANSLDCRRFRYGVPVKFQLRAFLDAQSEKDVEKVDRKDSSIASNNIYVWKNSKILDIEDYFGHEEKFHADKFLIHTNHPVLKKDRTKANTKAESIRRYNQAKEILMKKKKYDKKTLKEILSEHKTGICAHLNKLHCDYGITIASVIMDPKNKTMEVAWANPCRNKYKEYRL
jgi:isopenicillin-N N-acyltransferase-like protein